jgi:saccharopine dehydrogenase (NADP+, L-glutamate forming)
MLQAQDKDMVVMLHEFLFIKNEKDYKATSSLIVKGEDSKHTAMAQTVGLPLGIAAKLILQGKLQMKGLHIPVTAEIYEPVLEELAKHGIAFREETVLIE